METYTSPLTGTVYDVKPEAQKRVTRFEDGKGIWETYTQYNILLDGKMVQFCFDKTDIASTVSHLENPGPDLGSRFD
jgi:hypothetical protein